MTRANLHQRARAAALILILLAGAPSVRAQDAQSIADDRASTPTPAAIVRHLALDLRRLASRPSVITLVTGGALAAAAHPSDRRVVDAVSRNHAVEESLDAGSVAGDGYVQAGAAAAIYGIGAWMHRPGVAALGADLIEAQATTGLVTQALKVSVGRVRPDGGRRSFPSGHASATFATAQVIADRFGWRYGIAAYAGASYVAVSRLADRRHFTSDVVFGAALGIASAHAVQLSRRHRVTVAATPVRRGAMIVLIRSAR